METIDPEKQIIDATYQYLVDYGKDLAKEITDWEENPTDITSYFMRVIDWRSICASFLSTYRTRVGNLRFKTLNYLTKELYGYNNPYVQEEMKKFVKNPIGENRINDLINIQNELIAWEGSVYGLDREDSIPEIANHLKEQFEEDYGELTPLENLLFADISEFLATI